MSFILKENNIVINCKLTTYGRKLIGSGALSFNKWAVSDDEIDYSYVNNTGNSPSGFNILRPKDKNPDFVNFVLPTDNSTQPFTTLNPVIPIETVVKNTAEERGFFTGSTANGWTAKTTTDIVKQSHINVPLSGITNNTLQLQQGTSFALTSEPTVGDIIMIQWINPSYTGTTTDGVIPSNKVIPYLFYKIQSLTGTLSGNTSVVTLDRNVPNFNNYTGSTSAKAILYPGNNSYFSSSVVTNAWNNDFLAFDTTVNQTNDDVKVWNLSICYSEDIAGKQTGYETFGAFATSGYTGFKNYVNSIGSSQKSLAILHYTNNSVSNFYGEQFFSGTTVIDLPTIVWSKTSTVVGAKLRCLNTTTTKIFTGLNTPYYDLYVDDSYQTIVGKCFPNLKMVVIENEELIAALSYKSNRNWTLPTINNIGNGLGTTSNPNIFTNTNQVLYVSYLFDNTSGYTNNVSYGYKAGLHNQIYTTFSAETSNGTTLTNNQICRFTINDSELQYLTNIQGFNTGTGLAFNKFKIIYQLVSNGARPTPSAWKEYDFTSRLQNYSSWSGGTIPSTAFQNVNYVIDNNVITGGTTYDLNNYITIPTTSQTSVLNFGDETFLYGNLNTDISATVFVTKFLLTLPYNNFNTTTNPTFDETQNNVFISSIGIYDSNNNLVCVGKLSNPIEKKNNQTRLIELSIDF